MANGFVPPGSNIPRTGGPMTNTAPPTMGQPWAGIPGGLMAEQFAPLLTAALGLPGMPTQFSPQQSYYDQQIAQQFWQHSAQAAKIASDADSQRLRQQAIGAHRAMFGEMPNDQRLAQFDTMISGFQTVMPFLAQAQPELVNQMFGRVGSAQVASQFMLQAGQQLRDPLTGGVMSGRTAGMLSSELQSQMFGAGGVAPRGMNVGDAGMLFEAMTRHGMIGSGAADMQGQLAGVAGMSLSDSEAQRMASKLGTDVAGVRAKLDAIREISKQVTDGTKTIQDAVKEIPDMQTFTLQAEAQRITGKIRGMEGVWNAARDIFGPNVSNTQLLQGVMNLTQGGLLSGSSTDVAKELRFMQAVAHQTGIGMEGLTALQVQGAAVADQLGLDRRTVVGLANSSAIYGAALRQTGAIEGGGWGQQSPEYLQQMDLRLRAGAAASPLANQLGAVSRLAREGVFGADTRAGRMAAAIARGDTEFEGRNWGSFTPSEFLKIAQESGVDNATMTSAIRATGMNQEDIKANGIGDLVRESAQFETDAMPILSDSVAATLGGPKGAGAMRDVGNKVVMAIRNMDPKDQNSAAAQEKVIQEVLANDPRFKNMSPQEMKNTISQIRSNMSSARQRSASLRMFSSDSAMWDSFNKQAVERAAAMRPEAQLEAEMRTAMEGVGNQPLLARITETLRQSAEEGREVNLGEAMGRTLNLLDTTTEAGKRFVALQDEAKNGEIANERVNGKLTAKAMARQREIIAEIRELAPKLEEARDTRPAIARAGAAAASAAGRAAAAGTSNDAAAQPAASKTAKAEPMEVRGKIEITGLRSGMLHLFADNGDPSSNAGIPNDDQV